MTLIAGPCFLNPGIVPPFGLISRYCEIRVTSHVSHEEITSPLRTEEGWLGQQGSWTRARPVTWASRRQGHQRPKLDRSRHLRVLLMPTKGLNDLWGNGRGVTEIPVWVRQEVTDTTSPKLTTHI